ncbi:TRAP transporter small permease [Arthrobacter sulfonylureivorans]|uniref:TRAP transporter small permease n=1 Tax=Arthrobacter sulfonylureivorans TaxID=2486855 RepID=UPI0039E652FC
MSNDSIHGGTLVERPTEPRFLRWLSNCELVLAVAFFAILFFGVLWQVVGRYVPALNWPGAGEIARYSLVGVAFITVGYLIGKNGQITVAVIDNMVGKRGRVIVRYISAILLALICLGLAWEAWALFSDGFRRSTAVLRIPLGYLFTLPLIGFLSGTILAIGRILHARYEEPDLLTLEEEED